MPFKIRTSITFALAFEMKKIQNPFAEDTKIIIWTGWTKCTLTCGPEKRKRLGSCYIGYCLEFKDCNHPPCPGKINLLRQTLFMTLMMMIMTMVVLKGLR